MPKNTLSPLFVDIQYSTVVGGVTLDHHQKLGMNPAVLAGAATTVFRANGTTVLWSTAVIEWVTVAKTLFHTTSTFIAAELWSMPTPSSDPVFVATVALAIAGTSGASSVFANQAVWDFKGADDSDMRVTLLETNQAADQRKAYTAQSAAQKVVPDFFLAATCPFWTRGNAYPASTGILNTKTNDRIRAKRLQL
jgi:hypothetical protein